MNSKIVGFGSYLPEKILTNADLEKMVDTSDEWIVTRSGIRQRHIAAEDEFTSDLATKAAQEALRSANMSAAELDMIIVASISNDFLTPSTACIVQKNLGATGAAAYDISAACSGFLYGLMQADGMIKAGYVKNVLVVGAECLSKITDWTDRSTCVLFGDGGGAAIVTASEKPGILSGHMGASGATGHFITLQNMASPAWDNEQRAGQNPRTLYMNGNEVYKFAVKTMADAALKAVEKAGLTLDDIDYVVPHQANVRIIEGATKRLKISPDKVYKNIENIGNISSACIPTAMVNAIETGKIKPGDKVAMVGFGAGLTWASAVIEL